MDGTNDVKTHEPEQTVRLAARPRHAPKPERERKPEPKVSCCLGKRTYPVWTGAMWKVRDEFRLTGRKWYLLYDKLYDLRNLKEAWRQVETNGGAPGRSGETIEEYARDLDAKLTKLGEKLADGSFVARPIRRALIPKGDGSGRQRELGIPEVEDRLVQAALVRLIEPIFEAKFLDVSFGFRPERSAHNALARVEAAIESDRPILLDADIRNCFGSIPHEPLIEEVAREISDGKVLRLVRQFVEADVVNGLQSWTPERGTPQGAVLSPLLANIYMHQFDLEMTRAGFKVVRYADDFVVLCKTTQEALAAREMVDAVLGKMGLLLHPEKTRIVDSRTERFQFLGYEFWPKGREPRQSSMNKLREQIRKRTPRKSGHSLREVIRRLNPTLKGWYAYFRHSFWNVFPDVDGFVRRRLRSILRKFHKQRGTARPEDNARYPNHLFLKLGLYSLSQEHERQAGARGLIAFPARA